MSNNNRILLQRSETTKLTSHPNKAAVSNKKQPQHQQHRRLSLQQPIQQFFTTHHHQQQSTKPTTTQTQSLQLLLLGAPCTGKTCLTNILLQKKQFTQKHHPTIVEELNLIEVNTKQSRFSLELLELGGNYEFPAMRELYIKNSDWFLLCFELDEQRFAESLEEALRLLQEIQAINKQKNTTNKSDSQQSQPQIIFIATKSDLLTNPELLDNNYKYSKLISEYNVIQISSKLNLGFDKLWALLLEKCCNLVCPPSSLSNNPNIIGPSSSNNLTNTPCNVQFPQELINIKLIEKNSNSNSKYIYNSSSTATTTTLGLMGQSYNKTTPTGGRRLSTISDTAMESSTIATKEISKERRNSKDNSNTNNCVVQ